MKESTETEPLVYRVEQAAVALQLGRSTIYELIRSGQLRSVKSGRRRLVPKDAVVEYLESGGEAA